MILWFCEICRHACLAMSCAWPVAACFILLNSIIFLFLDEDLYLMSLHVCVWGPEFQQLEWHLVLQRLLVPASGASVGLGASSRNRNTGERAWVPSCQWAGNPSECQQLSGRGKGEPETRALCLWCSVWIRCEYVSDCVAVRQDQAGWDGKAVKWP